MKRICLALLSAALLPLLSAAAQSSSRPNILWITSEDNGPHLGCYGDQYATTPNLDALARRGLIFERVWSVAPVCAPARTAIISGLYPSSTGSEHMRSMTSLPSAFRMFPQFLRDAGYYCSNNSKEDYNLRKPGKVWDESSPRAHWKNRQVGQPFFAVFNHTITHESQIRTRPHTFVHDPAKVRLPAYHPDTPETRQDWAQYYDRLTQMDALAGQNLKELEEAGLAGDTIVFYFGDHGPGLPRSKRWPYNSGLRVPLIVYIPEKFKSLAPADYRAGGKSGRLVSFVDLAPTLLSLAGIRPPDWLHGSAFLGPHAGSAPKYLHGLRGRMDERYDLVRSVTDGRYVYIRNFMPHKIYGQRIDYMFQTPTTRVWLDLYRAGKLRPPQTHFWEAKPAEELYDLQTDPDETRNLASSPSHDAKLDELHRAGHAHALAIKDAGFLPEGEIHARSGEAAPYEMAHDFQKYPIEKILSAAETASSMDMARIGELKKYLSDSDNAVRYWGALGCLMLGRPGYDAARSEIMRLLEDPSPWPKIAAAEIIGQFGSAPEASQAVQTLAGLAHPEKNTVYVSMLALNAIESLGPKAAPLRDQIKSWPDKAETPDPRLNSYIPRLLENLREN